MTKMTYGSIFTEAQFTRANLFEKISILIGRRKRKKRGGGEKNENLPFPLTSISSYSFILLAKSKRKANRTAKG